MINLKFSKEKAAKPFTPTPASVNLLSPEVREVAAVQRARQNLLVAGALVLLAGGGLFAAQAGSTSGANDALAQATQEHDRLMAQQNDLDPIAQYYAQVGTNQETIQTTMSKEVLFSALTQHLVQVTPQGAAVETMSLTVSTSAAATDVSAPAANCPGPNPFDPGNTVGCVTMSGKAVSRDAVGSLIDNLNGDDYFTDAFVTTTTTDANSGEVSFVATVGVTDDVFSGRYADEAFIKGESK